MLKIKEKIGPAIINPRAFLNFRMIKDPNIRSKLENYSNDLLKEFGRLYNKENYTFEIALTPDIRSSSLEQFNKDWNNFLKLKAFL